MTIQIDEIEGALRKAGNNNPVNARNLGSGGRKMEDNSGDKDKALSPQEETAKASILAECDKLAKAGVTFVAVHFDGYGDEAATEQVKCFDGEWYAYAEHEPIDYDASPLQEHFETLVPFGYENDCGGFGDVVLDVAARKVTVERNDRFEDCTTTTYEV
jgi:hypothetical protein